MKCKDCHSVALLLGSIPAAVAARWVARAGAVVLVEWRRSGAGAAPRLGRRSLIREERCDYGQPAGSWLVLDHA